VFNNFCRKKKLLKMSLRNVWVYLNLQIHGLGSWKLMIVKL
jgi:hypothetical protein